MDFFELGHFDGFDAIWSICETKLLAVGRLKGIVCFWALFTFLHRISMPVIVNGLLEMNLSVSR